VVLAAVMGSDATMLYSQVRRARLLIYHLLLLLLQDMPGWGDDINLVRNGEEAALF
jgi:hypothetical protein